MNPIVIIRIRIEFLEDMVSLEIRDQNHANTIGTKNANKSIIIKHDTRPKKLNMIKKSADWLFSLLFILPICVLISLMMAKSPNLTEIKLGFALCIYASLFSPLKDA